MSATIQAAAKNGQTSMASAAAAPPRKYRVAMFGSFLGGYHVLRQLLAPPLSDCVEVIGVATDDPEEPFIHASVRLWKYDHSDNERWLVRHLAVGEGIPVFSGRINSDSFARKFTRQWKPDLCLMATFGQKIPRRLFEFPKFGFTTSTTATPLGRRIPAPTRLLEWSAMGRPTSCSHCMR
ncbi:MAG: hypothetical protein IPK15_21605 [Verrucomicrobia bacterium]|nr:hypothetical protein [Verrucomicrobiota bacterium]